MRRKRMVSLLLLQGLCLWLQAVASKDSSWPPRCCHCRLTSHCQTTLSWSRASAGEVLEVLSQQAFTTTIGVSRRCTAIYDHTLQVVALGKVLMSVMVPAQALVPPAPVRP